MHGKVEKLSHPTQQPCKQRDNNGGCAANIPTKWRISEHGRCAANIPTKWMNITKRMNIDNNSNNRGEATAELPTQNANCELYQQDLLLLNFIYNVFATWGNSATTEQHKHDVQDMRWGCETAPAPIQGSLVWTGNVSTVRCTLQGIVCAVVLYQRLHIICQKSMEQISNIMLTSIFM